MSKALKQKTAVLLIAILAMLPLQSLLASWQLPAGGDHCAMDMQQPKAEQNGHCPMHQADDAAAMDRCSSCDQCGGGIVAVFHHTDASVAVLNGVPAPSLSADPPHTLPSGLFRPPRPLA